MDRAFDGRRAPAGPRAPLGRRARTRRPAAVAVAVAAIVAGLLPMSPPAVGATAEPDATPAAHPRVGPVGPPVHAEPSAAFARVAPTLSTDPAANRDDLTAPHERVPRSVAATDRVVVTWDAPLGPAAAREPERLGRLTSATPGRDLRYVRSLEPGQAIYELDRPLGAEAAEILSALRASPEIEVVEPDLWVTPDTIPDDPLAAQLWGLLGADDGSPYGIDAVGAWPTTTGGGVVVAVIDTGIVAHPDLAGQTVPGWDMISSTARSNDGDGRDADPTDPGDWGCGEDSSWHGTHVAGTIAAVANNDVGVFGGAPGVKVQPVRVLGSCGGYASDIADGIVWAAGDGVFEAGSNATPAKVLNLSLGGDGACPTYVEAAIERARALGAVVAIAAGNSNANSDSFFPANCPGAFTVAATGSTGLKASFSNYGAEVDVAGPGVGVWSTIDSGATVSTGPDYAAYNGTSMATPHVALSAALVLAAYPGIDPDTVEDVLRLTATPFAADGTATGCPARGCGAGIVDVGGAVTSLDGEAPLVGGLAITPSVASSGHVEITARAVDLDHVTSAAVSIGGAAYVPMSAADGAFGATSEVVAYALPVPATDGVRTVCVRASDPGANTSSPVCGSFTVDRTAPAIAGLSVAPTAVTTGVPSSLSANLTDLAGLAGVQVRVDSGAWQSIAPTTPGAPASTIATLLNDTASQVSAGLYHVCALVLGGRVECWGDNGVGQLGDGSTSSRSTPVPVPGLTGVTAIAAGGFFSCALLDDTSVSCWGNNENGELGDGTTIGRSTPAPVLGLSGVTAIAAGAFHACAIGTGGGVHCWGYNGYGALGDGTIELRTSPVPATGVSGAEGVAAGGYHTCIRADGGVSCWGYNAFGQLGNGTTDQQLTAASVPGLTGVAQVSAGVHHTCALLGGGGVRCWGSNFDGNVGSMAGNSLCGATACAKSPVAVEAIGDAVSIVAAGYFGCAIRANRTMACWGDNYFGTLGDGTTDARLTPVPVFGLTGAMQVSGGLFHACSLHADGRVGCWGLGLFGQLGSGGTASRSTIAPVVGLDGRLAGGGRLVCLRATDTAGNTSNGSHCTTLTVTDTVAPTAAWLAALQPSPAGGTAVDFGLGFDEPITGLTSTDVLIGGSSTGWSAAISGGGSTWTIRLTAAAAPSGTVTLALKAGTVVDRSGNAGPVSAVPPASLTIDHTNPTAGAPGLTPPTAGDDDPVLVTATASDANGIAGAAVRVDAGPWIGAGANDGAFDEASEAVSRWVNDRVVSVSAGDLHTCAALASGRVGCWGSNDFAQLGDGTLTDRSTVTLVPGISTAVEVATSWGHSCARLADGTIRCWGSVAEAGSPLGDGTLNQRVLPVQVQGISSATSIAAGLFHTCAVLADGGVRCWGANASSQLGDGTTTPSSVPVAVSGISTARKVSAGGFHTCALLADTTVRCWGNNGVGAVGDGTTTNRPTPVAVRAGAGTTAPLAGVRALSAGIYSTCAVLEDGTGRCWGFENSGNLGDGGSNEGIATAPVVISGLSLATGIAVGGTGQGGAAHACATTATGSLRCWGFNNLGQVGDGSAVNRLSPVEVSGPSDVIAVTTGHRHTCAVSLIGGLRCWGANLEGALGDGAPTDRSIPTTVSGLGGAVSVASGGSRVDVDRAGPSFSCAVLSGGTVRCWGGNSNGQLGDGTTVDRPVSVAVSGLTGATMVTAGLGHACARRVDGTIRCWGSNSSGQLGDGSTTERHGPVTVTGITTAAKVSTGVVWFLPSGLPLPDSPTSTCALLAGGQVRCWGDNSFGQLGDGTTTRRLVPVTVTGISGAVDVASSGTHACALLGDGTVRCWGRNQAGQLGDGTTTNRPSSVPVRASVAGSQPLSGVTAITAGGGHTCALLGDGTARCWGENFNGQLGNAGFGQERYPVVVKGLEDAVALTGGSRHTCAAVADGTARCWGEPDMGKLGSPPSIWSTGVPQAVFTLVGVTDIAAGAVHGCAAVSAGAVRCWGNNQYGQIGDGTIGFQGVPKDVPGLGGRLSVGPHQVCVRATDRVGNSSAGNACTTLTITDQTPPAVASFVAIGTFPTGAPSVTYSLLFSEAIGGLSAGDFSLSGSSSGWSVSGVAGSGATRTVTVSGPNPTAGTLGLTLKAGSVVDGVGNAGPPSAASAFPVTILPFTDILGSSFFNDILWIKDQGITAGCGYRIYCPDATVSRGQMASFIARALALPATTTDYFADDDGTTHEPDINKLAAAGITSGCGPTAFCPVNDVTRGEMASFLVRALGLTAGASVNYFVDDNGTTHEQNINRLRHAGITSGCQPNRYCPLAPVTRGQMAAFLHRAFD